MISRLLALAAACAVAATPAAAQQHEHPTRHGQRMSPVAKVLEHRSELNLTAEQVTRLEGIDRDLQARNAPVREKLKAMRADSSLADQSRRERREAIRPVMTELHANLKAARAATDSVLDAGQREKARELLRADRKKMREERKR